MELRDVIGYTVPSIITGAIGFFTGRKKSHAQTVAIEVESLRIAVESLQATVTFQSKRIKELEAEIHAMRTSHS